MNEREVERLSVSQQNSTKIRSTQLTITKTGQKGDQLYIDLTLPNLTQPNHNLYWYTFPGAGCLKLPIGRYNSSFCAHQGRRKLLVLPWWDTCKARTGWVKSFVRIYRPRREQKLFQEFETWRPEMHKSLKVSKRINDFFCWLDNRFFYRWSCHLKC